jgi:hypothetical protein
MSGQLHTSAQLKKKIKCRAECCAECLDNQARFTSHLDIEKGDQKKKRKTVEQNVSLKKETKKNPQKTKESRIECFAEYLASCTSQLDIQKGKKNVRLNVC